MILELYLNTEMKFHISTYALCMNWMCSKEESSKQRGLWCKVQHPSFVVISKSSSQDSKDIDHKCRYGSMEDDVQHVEADRIQASSQEVVQPKVEKSKYAEVKITSK